MNQYGHLVEEYWKTHRRAHWEAIPEQERATHFEAIGERLAPRIQRRTRQNAGEGPQDEEYQDAVARHKTARFNAEQEILAEEFPPPQTPRARAPN